MCYPKPGPRCSKHAAERLKTALQRVEEYKGDDDTRKKALRERAVEAQKEYYTSPKGIALLEQKAKDSGDAKDVAVAKAAKERRQKMIAAYKAVHIKPAVDEAPALPIVAITPLKEPMLHHNMHIYGVEYDYDHYGCTGYTCGTEDGDGYCRDAEYENLRVQDGPVNTRAVLAQIFRCREDDVPDDLIHYAEDELSLNDRESYEVEGSRGYYGEEAETTIVNEANVREKLTEYYRNRPDANDDAGILPYLRGKGLSTAGLTPVEAVKNHLRAENRGIIVNYVERTNHVSKSRLKLSSVKVPQQKHFAQVEPRKPVAPNGVEKVCGIVVKKDNAFFLVDGYHRLKHETSVEATHGTFIVLSEEK